MEQPYHRAHPWRKLAITVGGAFLLVAGVVMLVTPGPGLVTIAAGLALLAREYRWARRVLALVRERIKQEQLKRRQKNEGR